MRQRLFFSILFFFVYPCVGNAQIITYPIVDTNVKEYFSDSELISEPMAGQEFYGQDATYSGNQPSYTDNGDSTITDNITGLMWQKYMGDKISYEDAFNKASNLSTANYSDWRVPSIKELYSLIQFTGQVSGQYAIDFFIDTSYFNQSLGDMSIGEREIDAQTWSSTQYVGLTMNSDSTVFGVNFIDGRIKGYPKYVPSNKSVAKTMYFRLVRGNPEYGNNSFIDNQDGTISDMATGLMWQQSDDGVFRDWEEALACAENMVLADYDDWRLPNAKELQSIVDYSRSPQTTQTPAINPLFQCTEIYDPDGNPGQYPYYWTSTSHKDGANPYSSAVYIAFGEAQGLMNENLMDVHGAGAQRSDPKSGNTDDYPMFFGPQGDVRYVYNAVRAVRDIKTADTKNEFADAKNSKSYPNPATDFIYLPPKEGAYKVEILDLSGRILIKKQINSSGSASVDIRNLNSGIFVLNTFSNYERNTMQFVKE